MTVRPAVPVAASLLLLVTSASACAATHIKETYVFSRVPGARVIIAGREVGKTPLRVRLDFGRRPGADRTIPIRLEMEGYQPQTSHITFEGPAAVVFPLERVKEGKE